MYSIDINLMLQFDLYKVNRLSKHALDLGTVKNKKYAFFKEMFERLICKVIRLQCIEFQGSQICFYGNSNLRQDHVVGFENAYKCAQNNCWRIEGTGQFQINPVRTIKLLVFFLFYFRKKIKGFKGCYKWSLVCSYVIMADFLNEIRMYDFAGTKLGVVYYDLTPTDYVFVEYLKLMNIKTATLQHGLMTDMGDKYNIYFDSTSDFFLAMNPFTRDEAIKAGMDENKIMVLGIIKEAWNNHPKRVYSECGIFGVLLPGEDPVTRGDSEMLIEYANFIAKKYGYKFYIKYHPNTTDFKYDKYAVTDCFNGHMSLETSVEEYANMVDFTLMSSSTALFDLVYLKHRVFLMEKDNPEDNPFKNININKFRNKNELVSLLNKDYNVIQQQLFEYLCYTEHPEKNYIQFFKEFY